MKLKNFIAGLSGALILLLAVSGCNRSAPADNVAPLVTEPKPPVVTEQPQPPATSQTPLKDSIEAYLAKHSDGKILPKNVKLLSVNLDKEVATLDFSKEFQQLANLGDSTEGEVQRELCKLVAKFPNIEKLRVTVEGGAFDSQMADWSTPFPVRNTAQAEDVTQKPSESRGGQ